jgi:hypothetical protein
MEGEEETPIDSVGFKSNSSSSSNSSSTRCSGRGGRRVHLPQREEESITVKITKTKRGAGER